MDNQIIQAITQSKPAVKQMPSLMDKNGCEAYSAQMLLDAVQAEQEADRLLRSAAMWRRLAVEWQTAGESLSESETIRVRKETQSRLASQRFPLM
jgi:hypothetical protein